MIKKDKIKRAVEILKQYGVKEIYILGSAISDDFTQNSDLDIAIRGLPDKLYFTVAGELMMQLNMSVDLIDLDEDTLFTRYLIDKGELLNVA